MSDESRCPRCDGVLPEGTAPDQCPRCLMRVAAEENVTAPGRIGEPPRPEDLAPLFPQLEIGELLGRGGMGVVYRARQTSLDRSVALKLLAVGPDQGPEFAERFRREARALASLNHPNIVSVHDFGRAGDHYFLLMEFVDGTDLRRLIEARELEPQQALALVGQVCDALQYAHEEGVVHRDIKPENILVDRKGRAKIADFGLAKILGKEAADLSMTGSRQVMGTVHYMAPEQVNHPQAVDHRADIYSLGVVLYELLTGELPMGRFQPPSRKIQVDLRVDEIVLKALEHEPQLRYQQASEVKTDLDRVSGTAAGGGSGTPTAPASRQGPGGLPWISAIVLVAFASLVGALFLVWGNRSGAPGAATGVGGTAASVSGGVRRAGEGESSAGVGPGESATAGTTAESPPNPALVEAAARGFLEGVRLIMAHGADVNARDLTSDTALIAAAKGGHLDVVEFLLDAGADVDLRGVSGTPLAVAAYSGHLPVVRRLLREHPDLEAAGFLGSPALILAIDQGHVEIVRLLLEHGADRNARSWDGNTALEVAAAKGNAEILDLLRAPG